MPIFKLDCKHARGSAASQDTSDGNPAAAPLGVLLLLTSFVICLSLHGWLSRQPGPVWNDVAEAWAWGRQLEWGYYKHPPFFAWVARVWFDFFGRSDGSAYLLAAATTGSGLAGVWFLARRHLDANGALLATALLVLTPYYSVLATNFNANTVLLGLWPWTALFLARTLETQAWRDAALFGSLAAASLLSKYVSVLFLLTCLATAIAHPKRRQIFSSEAPYIAILVCLILTAPHMWWVASEGASTLRYAIGQTSADNARKLHKAVMTAATLALTLAPMIFALVYAIGTSRFRELLGRLREAGPSSNMQWLAVLACGTPILTLLLGLAEAIKIHLYYFIPMIFALPLALLTCSGASISSAELGRGLRIVGVYCLLLVVLSPAIALGSFIKTFKYAIDPSREVANVATRLWHERVGRPVKLVSGSELYSLGLTFYSADRPAEFTRFDREAAPWATPARIATDGLLAVCLKEDASCITSAETHAGEGTVRVARTFETKLSGFHGPDRIFEIFLIPPQAAPAPK